MNPTSYPATCWATCTYRASQASTVLTPIFTDAELGALEPLRRRYARDCDRFDEHELAHLRFLRWLCHTGRLSA